MIAVQLRGVRNGLPLVAGLGRSIKRAVSEDQNVALRVARRVGRYCEDEIVESLTGVGQRVVRILVVVDCVPMRERRDARVQPDRLVNESQPRIDAPVGAELHALITFVVAGGRPTCSDAKSTHVGDESVGSKLP